MTTLATKYEKASDAFYENNEALVKSRENQAKMQESMAKIGEAVTNVKNAFLQNFTPIIADAAEQISEFVQGIDGEQLVNSITGIINVFKALLPVITAATAGFYAYKAALAISAIIDAVKKATEGVTIAQAALNAVMAANPFVLIATAIAAVVAALVTLFATNEDFRNAVIEAWNAIGEAFHTVWDNIVNFFTETIPEVFSAVIEFFQNNWQSLLLLIVNPFAGAFKLLYDNCETFRNFINNLWNDIYNAVISFGNSVVSFFTETIPNLISSIIEWFSELPYEIGRLLGETTAQAFLFGQNLANWVTTEIPQIITSVINWFAQLPERIQEWLTRTLSNIIIWGTNVYFEAKEAATKAVSSVIEWFAKLPERIWNWLTETVEKVKQWGTDVYESAKEAIGNLATAIVDWFKDLPNKMLEVGKNLVEGLWNGILSMKDWVFDKISDFFNGIIDGVKDTLGIHSPSRVFAEIGEYSAEGMGVGWSNKYGNIKKQIDGDLNFDKQSVSFDNSGVGALSRSISGVQATNESGQIYIDLTATLDGAILSKKMYNYNKAETMRRGASFA